MKISDKLKNPAVIITAASIIGLAIAGYAYFHFSNGRTSGSVSFFDTDQATGATVAKKMDLREEITASGKIQPAENVDLAFERGGKVAGIYVAVGDTVEAGKVLAVTENAEYSAALMQAQASVAAQEAKLAELRNGARPEEIQIQETLVANAEQTRMEAENNVQTVKDKAAASLQDAYNNNLIAAQEGVEAGKSALFTLTDLQYAHFMQNDQTGLDISNAKAAAVSELLGLDNAGAMAKDYINLGMGGAYGQVQLAASNPTAESIEAANASTISSLRKIKQALDLVTVNNSLTAAEKTSLDLAKTTIVSKINALTARQQAISVQKTTNANLITAAETGLVSANSALATAKDQLALKKAGATAEQLRAQEALVQQAKAAAASAAAQLGKTIIHAPISGTITKADIKVGEIITANVPAVSLISAGKFEIETSVSEADVVKVKVGSAAEATIDAYGSGTVFQASVTSIDPAETLVNGVPTYKVTLQFALDDERIKSGMTANVKIFSEEHSDAIAIPERAVITKGSEKFVMVKSGDSGSEERKVETGINGANGYIEIISGLREGESILDFGNNQ